jgi:predicted MFS family arabinose efflux permease
MGDVPLATGNGQVSRARPGRERAGAFRALRTRNYRLFFVGQVLSVIGTWVQTTAVGWIVLHETHDSTGLGVVVALQFLPLLVLGAWAGTIADRSDKRQILVLANVAAALVALATALLVSNGQGTVAALAVTSLLLGCAMAFEMPTRQSFIAELVQPQDIPSAVGLNGATMTGARVVGSGIAGGLLALLGASICLYVNAASFLAVILALLMMRPSELRPTQVIERGRRQIRDGLRYALHAPEVRFPLLAMAVVGTISLNSPVIAPLLARITFHAGPELFAAFGAAGALGALIGSLVAARALGSTVLLIGQAAFAFGAVYSLTAFAPWAWLAMVGLGAAFFFASMYIAWTNARLQQESDTAYRGRVMALYSIVFLGSTPIGSIIVSAVSEATNPRVAVLLGGLAAAGTGLVALARVRRHERLEQEPITAS